jgi:hypothetical protein
MSSTKAARSYYDAAARLKEVVVWTCMKLLRKKWLLPRAPTVQPFCQFYLTPLRPSSSMTCLACTPGTLITTCSCNDVQFTPHGIGGMCRNAGQVAEPDDLNVALV